MDRAARSPTDACTCAQLRKASRRVSQLYDQHLEPHGLTITQFGLLVQLRFAGPIGIGPLAARMVTDPTTLTRNLRPLERRGFIAVAPDPGDRRARRLSLTAAGRRALRAARPGWEQAQAAVRAALGADETAELHAVLGRALDRLGA